MVWIHFWPLVCAAACTYLTKCSFVSEHASYVLKFGPFYLAINAFGCWERGYALYPFLPWNGWTDYKSMIVGISLFVAGVYLFYGTCKLVNWFKGNNNTTTSSPSVVTVSKKKKPSSKNK